MSKSFDEMVTMLVAQAVKEEKLTIEAFLVAEEFDTEDNFDVEDDGTLVFTPTLKSKKFIRNLNQKRFVSLMPMP